MSKKSRYYVGGTRFTLELAVDYQRRPTYSCTASLLPCRSTAANIEIKQLFLEITFQRREIEIKPYYQDV